MQPHLLVLGMSNATVTNYFTTVLQNIDVANLLLVFIYAHH